MAELKNLENLSKDVSNSLYESLGLIDILIDLSDDKSKTILILEIIKKNIKSAFYNIEDCRQIISIPD